MVKHPPAPTRKEYGMKAANKKALKSMLAKVADMREMLEAIRDEEQMIFDEKSEKWQESARGEKAQEELDNLESLDGSLEEMEGIFEELGVEND